MSESVAIGGSPAKLVDAPGDRRFALLTKIVRYPNGRIAIATLLVLGLAAIFAPLVTTHDPLEMHMADRFAPPSGTYWFGTDEFGRDIYSRLVYGTRVSLLASVVAVSIATVIGVPFGLAAGYFGGYFDSLVMRLVDFMLAVPGIILAMVIVVVLGPNVLNAMVAIAIIGIPTMARLTRASTLAAREREYVEAARSIGASDRYILTRTILPNIAAPIIVQVAIAAAAAVLLEATLSFLGLGTQPPTPSWGNLLSTARQYMFNSTWYGVFPGLLITILVLSLNSLADVIREILDPASRRVRSSGRATRL
jgi:peptide/nickel transport system permease protein/oligopeptide transport system permease protein